MGAHPLCALARVGYVSLVTHSQKNWHWHWHCQQSSLLPLVPIESNKIPKAK